VSNFPLKIRLPRLAVAIQFTTEGLIFVLLSLAIGAAAVNTGNNVLYLIFSLMLGLIIVSGILSRRMLSRLKPQIEFPEHLFAGASNVCFIRIRNSKKRLPSIAIRFLIRAKDFPPVSRYFFYISPASEVSSFAPVLFPQRGLFELKEMDIQTRFPFSFFLKSRRYFLTQKILVYPRLYRLTDEVAAHFTHGMIIESPYRGEGQQLFHLRDYGPFDSSKRIHWKASAKTEKLLIKEFQKEHGRDLYLYFNCYPKDQSENQVLLFERAVSFVGSLALLFLEKEIGTKVVFPDQSFEISAHHNSLMPLLVYLACMKAVPPEGTPEIPDTNDSVAVELRSSRIPPAIVLPWPNVRVVFVEQWVPMLRESLSAAFGQEGH